MALPSSSSVSRRSHRFTPIPEGSENEELTSSPSYHHTTPMAPAITAASKRSGKKRIEKSVAVTCNNCRPNSRDKTASSVVPVAGGSPTGIFKSVVCAITKRSPKPLMEERWKIVAAELSHKLVQASRKREEAILEASKLKYAVAELEKKLGNLESSCNNLNSGFGVTECHEQIIQNFRFFVSESRSAVRSLSRALMSEIWNAKAFERISSLISQSENPNTLIFYLEALLNSILFEDFESPGFTKTSMNRILNPLNRCKAQYAAFNSLHGLTWEEVLNKGTKHFSEDFSRFCDRKMSEIVGSLGWNRAWTEPLLQAFFNASKSVWLVHLLANSVHPSLTIFRAEKGLTFDSDYMDDVDVDQPAQCHPTEVLIMVAPGFYVYDGEIKCKVLCKYSNAAHER